MPVTKSSTGSQRSHGSFDERIRRPHMGLNSSAARRVFILTALLLAGMMGTARSSAAASTEPGVVADRPPDGPVDQSCSFTLSAPTLTTLPGGAKAVTATLVASTCSGDAQATSSTICVATPDGPGNCATAYTWDRAKVFVTSSRMTGRFTATGNGCWQVTGVSGSKYTCAQLGPVTTTV